MKRGFKVVGKFSNQQGNMQSNFCLWMTCIVVNSWSMRFQCWESMRVWRDISYRGNFFQTSRCFAACSPISKKYMRSCRSWTNFDSSPLRTIARAQIPAPGYVSSNIWSSQMTVDKFLPRPSLAPFSASKTRKFSGINNNGRHRKLAAYCATNSPSTGTTSPRAVTMSPHCTSRNNKQVFRVFASLAGPSVKPSQHSAANLPPQRRTLSVECVRSQCPWFQQSLPQVFPPIATNWGVPSWVPRAKKSHPLGWLELTCLRHCKAKALKGMVCCNVFCAYLRMPWPFRSWNGHFLHLGKNISSSHPLRFNILLKLEDFPMSKLPCELRSCSCDIRRKSV